MKRCVTRVTRVTCGCFAVEKLRVVKVKSWDELPEILEPGVYNVDGEVHVIEEDVPKKAILRALKYRREGKTLL